MTRFVLIPPLLLAACTSPSPEFIGVANQSVTLEGIRFSVFQQGERVQVIRHGYLTPRQRGPVPWLMMQAAQKASGCQVVPGSFATRLDGDTGVGVMYVNCDARDEKTDH